MSTATQSHRADNNPLKRLSRAGVYLLSLPLLACSAVESRSESEPAPPQSHEITLQSAPAGDAHASSPGDTEAGAFSRSANLTAGLVGSVVKTYATDPVVRPVSTARSFGYLFKNSVTDFTRRVYVNTVRLPAVKARPIPPLSSGPGMDLEAWERELDRITGSQATMGSLSFLVDGEEFFTALTEEIGAARQSIQLRTYIFDNDDFAVQIADLLKRRSQDVEVTVLMDGIGTITAANVMPASLPDSHDAPGSMARYLEAHSRVRARQMTNPFFTGDHCKVAIIDKKVAFLGGMNIGREYRYEWHDLMVRVEGPVVEQLARDADEAWAEAGPWGDLAGLLGSENTAGQSHELQGYPVRLLYTRADDSQIYKAKVEAIRRARQYVYVENPYFSDDIILYELIKARRRGVDVRFVISNGGDHPWMDKSNARAINEMLENGIRVYVYPKMTHAKAAIIDGWLTVGSANLDHLSLRVNNEVNVATSNPRAVQALKERLFERDFEASTELNQKLPTNLSYWLAEMWADAFM